MNKYLSKYVGKKILLSVLTAGVLSGCVFSVAGAEAVVANKGEQNTLTNQTIDKVEVYGGVVTLNGGKVTGEYSETEDESSTYAAIVESAGGKLVANDVAFNGFIEVNDGGYFELNGGSITSPLAWYKDENGDKQYIHEDLATHGGEIVVRNADINYSVIDASYGGKITLENTNIKDSDFIWAGATTIDGGKDSGQTPAAGELVLNGGDNNTYTAKAIIASGGAKIYINGGTLQAAKLKELMYNQDDGEGGKLNTAAGGIVLANDGKISTMTDQIFANAASADNSESGEVTNTGISYVGGTLVFDDAQYTLAYLLNAKDELKAYQSDSQTKITMNGELVDSTIDIDQIDSLNDDETISVELDKVTVNANENLLVGVVGVGGDYDNHHQVENGFQIGALNIAGENNGAEVIITNDKAVTLGGSAGGELITINGNANEKLEVHVGYTETIGDSASTKGVFNIGNSQADKDTKYTLTALVHVNKDSELNVKGQTEITGGITLDGAKLDVQDGGMLVTNKIEANDGSIITGTVQAGALGASKTTDIINIGTAGAVGKAGSIIISNEEAGKVGLKGGMVFLDPAFKDGDTISDASGLAIAKISELDGSYVAGQNSLISFGSADLSAAREAFADSQMVWGEDVTAAVYVASSINAASGAIIANGSLVAAPAAPAKGTVSFADKSLLLVDGNNVRATAAITGVNTLTVGEDAKLYIANAEHKGVYHIVSGENENVVGGDNVWEDDNIKAKSNLFSFAGAKEGNDFIVTATLNDAATIYGGAVIAPGIIDAAMQSGSGAAYEFFTAASDSTTSIAAQAKALNNAASMSELAGVSHATYSASNILTDAVTDHMSLAKNLDHDTDIWAHYVHTKENIDGLAVANGSAKYDAQYNGIVVGADLYKQGKATVGAALTYIDGKVTGAVKNDAEYYGLSIYGGIENENSAVIGDISYLHGKNEITQHNSGYTLTGEPKSDALSVGVRAEKSFKAGNGKLVPYAGLRYLHLGTGNYTNSIGLKYDADDANLFLLPVGVKYSAEHKTAGWTLRPIVEVGYVWAMGDRDSEQTVSLSGASDGFGYDVTDSGSYFGRLAVEAEKANVTYSLGYEYQKGDSVKANKWMANLNWKF